VIPIPDKNLDDDLAAEQQMIAEVRDFLNRDRTNSSIFDLNNDGLVDFDDLRDALLRFEWIIFSGVLLTLLPILNWLEITSIDGDLFWSLAGFCLLIEGLISVYQIRNMTRRKK
tara:strand:+ start:29962 stop:30303 length:342 start_codon:yes stop_codon:yes gene_type:complete